VLLDEDLGVLGEEAVEADGDQDKSWVLRNRSMPAPRPRGPSPDTHVFSIHSISSHLHALQALGNDGDHLQLSLRQEPVPGPQAGGSSFIHIL
jgi:hypothetical protein